MKVDSIYTRHGDFIVGYTKLNRGFYIESFPKIITTKSGISVGTGRDNSFKSMDELVKHVNRIVANFEQDYKFVRKVICYEINADEYFRFKYMICNENEKTHITGSGSNDPMNEYSVLETNINGNLGRRNIMGQLMSGKEVVLIDYDEDIHKFIVEFVNNFEALKSKLKNFFNKEDLHKNIMQSLEQKQK